MRILLFGKNGQLGWELQRSLGVLGELIALDKHGAHHCGDLTHTDGIYQTIVDLRPSLVVNAAAYTAVDLAESEPERAHLVNAIAPGHMARAAQHCGAAMVHFSTDYVFDGSGQRAWTEADAPSPLNVYGTSKLAGEQAVAKACARHLILRTSWVHSARGQNFVRSILRAAAERDSLSVVNDQTGAPTGADLLADAAAHAAAQLLRTDQGFGTYHLSASGETTWHAYAQHVLALADQHGYPLRTPTDGVQAVPTSGYPTQARRPLNSRLDCRKFVSTFGLCLPHWQAGVGRTVSELLYKHKP